MTALPLDRQGTCRPSACGSACCRTILLEVNPIYLTDPDLAAWVRLHGLDLIEVHGRALVKIPLACSALTSDGRCSLYGQPERPRLCADFPQAPASLTGIEGVCTYTFAGTDVALTAGEESTRGADDGNRERARSGADGPRPREAAARR